MKREDTLEGDVAPGSLAFVTKINIYGFGLRVVWIVTNIILLPNLVQETVQTGLHGTALGMIGFLGVGLAVFVQPIAGRLSDAWPGADIRRPFIITGTLVLLPSLVILGSAVNAGMILLGFVGMQLGANIAQAAFQAFIPDLIPKEHRGLASGVKNILAVLGSALGLLGAEAILLVHDVTGWVVVYVAVVFAIVAMLTLIWVPRIPGETDGSRRSSILPALNLRALWREAVLALREHVTFRRAVLAQFLFMLGTYPSERFLVLYLNARFGDNVHQIVAIGGVAAILIAILSAGLGGTLSDRIGRPNVLIAATVLGGAGMIMVGLATTIPILIIAGALLAVGYGAFLSVNWALLNDDLPAHEYAAALGVANIASAGASAIAGLFGPIVDIMNASFPQGTYQVLFGIAGLVTLLAVMPLGRILRNDDV